MDIQNLKDYINDNGLISTILENLGCHHIARKSGYYTAGNPDGDNFAAISVYENEYLTTVDYTRDIVHRGRSGDIFDLVQYFKECNFFHAVKTVCEWIDLDYYADPDDNLPESLRITKLILEMQQGDEIDDEDKPIKPIPEAILSYYQPFVNDFFKADNIFYSTQTEFEVGYDEFSNRITIPIRDELGTLIGVKGRLFKREIDENESKYLYIEPTNRSKILYGLHKTMPYILRSQKVYITESEKGVMQLWNMGYCNAVATGGKKVSQSQIEKLTRLCADIVFLFDKDVKRDELSELADRFVDCVKIFAVIDNENILNEKESPTDNPEKFKRLLENCCERIK